MKTNSLLFIASLAVLTSSASAASNQNASETVVLPTYVVTAPRYLPVEQQVNASLKEFTRQAAKPMVVAPVFTLPKAGAPRNHSLAAARMPHAVRIAKS